MRDPSPEHRLQRRQFLTRTASGLGALSVNGLLDPSLYASPGQDALRRETLLRHFAPRARRVVFLFMAGGPSHLDLWDPKPGLQSRNGSELPPSIRQGQRITTMTRGQKQLLVAASPMQFRRYGNSGQVMNEHLPLLGKMADEMAIVRSIHSEPINHDPAVNMIQTGAGRAGRPCIGSWVSWALGSENRNLPDFVVLLSGSKGQPVISRYYNNGFLPSRHQGVQFLSQGEPVLFLSNPKGINQAQRNELIAGINALNRRRLEVVGDPEIEARIDSFELAGRMQTSVPELMDIRREPKHIHEQYGTEPGKVSYANNCLLARRLLERGVRFVQLYQRGWDMHNKIKTRMPEMCRTIDRPTAALIEDLRARGMLEDTLIVWGGEFGRTTYCQGELVPEFGRDHHPRCFSMWLAGGGIRGGTSFGRTDDYGYNIVEDGVHIHDLQATVLHCLGMDHTRLTYRFQGRDQRLTDIGGEVVHRILS